MKHKGDNNCLYVLILRTKHELCYNDDDEPIEISCYDDTTEHIRYSHVGCNCFTELFINFSKTIEDLGLISYSSIQDYFDYTKFYNSICPIQWNFRKASASPSLYYSREYDYDYDDGDDDFYELADTIQNYRAKFSFNL